jgi:hypothetical protein
MSERKVWFITGAGRGMGVEIAKAALAARNAVVATGRNTDAVAEAVGEADDLLVVKLDVTSRADAEAAVQAAAQRFGRIDVLVNNAGNFYAGYFEELTPEQIERQLATVTYAQPSLADYADRTAEQLKWWEAQSGQQPGDPASLGKALVTIAGEEEPPRRFIAGADAIALAEQKVADLQAQINTYRDLSTSLALDYRQNGGVQG